MLTRTFQLRAFFSIAIAICGFGTSLPLLAGPNGPVVVVTGHPDCSGVLSNYCGWGDGGNGGESPSWGEPPGGSGGGAPSGGSGSPPTRNADDGTKGKDMNNRRTVPGCMRESQVMSELLSALYETGQPVGEYLPIDLQDPAYKNGSWAKYQYVQIYHTSSSPDWTTMKYQVNIHYMYNLGTGQIAQVKFVNSYEYGCLGLT